MATPALEAELLAAAESATAGQLQTLIRRLKRDGKQPPQQRASISWDDHGMLHVNAVLSPEAGAEFEAAIRAAKEQGQPGHDLEAPDPGLRDDEQRQVTTPEALTRLAQNLLAGTTTAQGVLPERFQTIVHLQANPTSGCGCGDHGLRSDEEVRAWIQGGAALDHDAVLKLFCEAWITVLVTSKGKPVLGVRPQRLADDDQIRALWVRDGRCRFPGCGRTAYLKAHHVTPDCYGGPTSLDNLVLLCQKHHTLIHRPGWQFLYHPDTDTIEVYRPDRTRVEPQRPAPTRPARPPTPTQPRFTGLGERLTPWAADVIIAHWQRTLEQHDPPPDPTLN